MVGGVCVFGVFCCGFFPIVFFLKILCFHFNVYCLFLLCPSSAWKITLFAKVILQKTNAVLAPQIHSCDKTVISQSLRKFTTAACNPTQLHGSKTTMNQVNFPQFTKAVKRCEIGSSSYYLRRNTQETQAGDSNFLSV